MEFTVICPNHGPVEVELEDVTSIVFHGAESVDVVFACPKCDTEISISAKMPQMLITTLDLSELLERSAESDEDVAEIVEFINEDGEVEIEAEVRVEYRAAPLSAEEEERIEHYCEYFRRQLRVVDTVERFLEEVDCK
jgi:DNA-directed RNA polymerase subunit M/transcription elongation factor TFIIS